MVNDKIRKMVEDGFAIRIIERECGLSRQSILNIIYNNSFNLKKELFDESKIENICLLYERGVSAKNLGIKYSIDKRKVQRWARERGMLRSKSDSHRITYFNQHFFDVIDTPAKAYWLGFLYADAYNAEDLNNTVSISLNGKDNFHLKKLAHAIDLPMEKVYRRFTSLGYDVASLKIYSAHMCSVLSTCGCPRAKSFIITYPEWLKFSLDNHFIRGLFDGDGCLTYRKKQKEWKWSLVSTKECCEKIQDILQKKVRINVSCVYISKTNNNTFALETSGNEKIYRIMNWLYEDSYDDILLSRKHEKFLRLKSERRWKR